MNTRFLLNLLHKIYFMGLDVLKSLLVMGDPILTILILEIYLRNIG